MKKLISIITTIMIISSLALLPDFNYKSSLTTAYAFDNQGEAEAMLMLINNERAKKNLSPLKLYPLACEKANVRAVEISSSFSHTRPNGSECFSILNNIAYQYAGENIAMNYSKLVDGAMSQWMNSEGHRNNILSKNYTHIGIGCYCKNGAYYWVQIFLGNPSGYSGEYIPLCNNGTPFSYGDVDGNSKVNALDASRVLANYSLASTGHAVVYSLSEKKASDVNQDGKVDALDASIILSYYALSSTGQYPYFDLK